MRHRRDGVRQAVPRRGFGLTYNWAASSDFKVPLIPMTILGSSLAVLGGLLIGLSALLLLLSIGRIAGISGIVFGLGTRDATERGWRLAFLAGLAVGTLLMLPIDRLAFAPRQGFPLWALLCAGFLVGYGSRLGNGCTSGHGVCGLGRRAPRSLAATFTFMTVAMVTVLILRHTLGVLP